LRKKFIVSGKTVMLEKRHRILVVDDETAITLTLGRILEDQGYKTATANSGEEAVSVACSFQPDFIVSDIVMGEMNGIEAALKILVVVPKCKVLFMSGNAHCLDLLGRDLLVNARARGFKFEILAKPVPPRELLGRISKIFADENES
jgi:CheY-like chemotaxis protein